MHSSWLNFRFFCAVAVLVGMIVGAGVFGLPYVFSQVGFFAGLFYLIALAGISLLVHLFYGEIILRTSQPHRLVGYTAKYLGSRAKKIFTGVILFEYYGALLAYIILGGEFLSIIFGRWIGGPVFVWAIIFFLAGAFGVFCRHRALTKSEFFMTFLLLGAVAVLLIKGAPLVEYANLGALNLSKFFLPYGVILFALAGAAAIPEMRLVLQGEEKKLKPAIFLGTLIPVVLYIFFALVVVGISGSQTSPEAIKGLVPHLGEWATLLGSIFGLLAVFTSFLVLGMSLRKTYQYDYHLKSLPSFFLACVVPIAAYLLGLKNFILVIGFVGTVASGLMGILTVLIYFKARRGGDRYPEYHLAGAKIWGSLLILIFVLGIIYQFIYLSAK